MSKIKKIKDLLNDCDFRSIKMEDRLRLKKVEALLDELEQRDALTNESEVKIQNISMTKTKVMVVDDDMTTIQILQFFFRSKSEFELFTFSDPVKAYNEIDSIMPEVIILDLMMPGMNGFEFLKNIQSKPSSHQMKIIVCSGKTFTSDRLKSLKLGAADFLEKPINLNELLSRIREAKGVAA